MVELHDNNLNWIVKEPSPTTVSETDKGESFFGTKEAAVVLSNPEFLELYGTFEAKAEEAEEIDVLGQDLPPEDDDGPVEYKLKLCGLDTNKVIKRTTQMAFRLTQGKGEAYYEIGVHDNGQLVGIEQEEVFETMLVLFHIAAQLEATLEVCEVRLGPEGYSVQLRTTKPEPHAIEPELDGFFNGLNFLNKKRMYEGSRGESTCGTESQSN